MKKRLIKLLDTGQRNENLAFVLTQERPLVYRYGQVPIMKHRKKDTKSNVKVSKNK